MDEGPDHLRPLFHFASDDSRVLLLCVQGELLPLEPWLKLLADFSTTIQAGGETGSASQMNPQIMKIFLYVLPPFSAMIMAYWPGALQITFFLQAVITFTQSAALRRDWFRNMIGIQPLPKPENLNPKNHTYKGKLNKFTPPEIITEPKSKGILGGAKSDIQAAFSSLVKQGQQRMGQSQSSKARRTPGEIKHAKAYDEKRKREIAQEKFEREQDRLEKMREDAEGRRQRGSKGRR